MKKSIEWKPISKTIAYTTRVFEVQNIKSISPTGEEKTFIALKSPEWVIVIPIVKKNVAHVLHNCRIWKKRA